MPLSFSRTLVFGLQVYVRVQTDVHTRVQTSLHAQPLTATGLRTYHISRKNAAPQACINSHVTNCSHAVTYLHELPGVHDVITTSIHECKQAKLLSMSSFGWLYQPHACMFARPAMFCAHWFTAQDSKLSSQLACGCLTCAGNGISWLCRIRTTSATHLELNSVFEELCCARVLPLHVLGSRLHDVCLTFLFVMGRQSNHGWHVGRRTVLSPGPSRYIPEADQRDSLRRCSRLGPTTPPS